MMQHRPNPDRTHAESLPAEAATPRVPPVAAPHREIDIDLTDPTEQRAVAADLGRLLEGRKYDSEHYVQYFSALHRYELSELLQKNIVFTPELQIQMVKALSTDGYASGRAETILIRIAQMEGAIHEDALVALADLGHIGCSSARSCVMKLAKLQSPPHGLFVGDLGSIFGAMVAERPGLRKHPTPIDLIRPCADFMGNRLRCVMNGDSAIPLELRARAFTETLLFFVKDIARSKELRGAEAVRVLNTYDLTGVVEKVIQQCAFSLRTEIYKWLLRKEAPRVRIKSLVPSVNREALAHGFREAFMKRFASNSQ